MLSLLKTDLWFNTAFHPEADGQSEVTIRVLENFLWLYIEHRPSTWTAQLPLAEFATNNGVNVSTGFTPFYLNSGQHPVIPTVLLARGKPKSSNEGVKEALERMKTALADAQTNLQRAQERMKRAVDKWRRSETYKVGDEVVLTTPNLCSYCPHLPLKIKARWVEPFRITREISPVVYGLDLPLGWRIHPVFHVSKLKRYIRLEEFLWEVEPPPPILIGDTLEYEVEGIRQHQDKGARHCYLVLLKGYPLHKATWEPESHLANAPDILEEYLCRVLVWNRERQ